MAHRSQHLNPEACGEVIGSKASEIKILHLRSCAVQRQKVGIGIEGLGFRVGV